MRVAVRKLDGVRSVTVSLNDGYADILLASQNTVTVERIREAIRRNGFSPREALVRVSGTVVRQGEQLVLEVAGSGTTFLLAGAPEALERLARATGGSPVTLDGSVPESQRGSRTPLVFHLAGGPGRRLLEERAAPTAQRLLRWR